MQVDVTPGGAALAAAALGGLAYTLLSYSRDGDDGLRLRDEGELRARLARSTPHEVWAALSEEQTAPLRQVSWNVHALVAGVAALSFVSLWGMMQRGLRVGPAAGAAFLVVFSLQDAIVRWRQAHRIEAAVRRAGIAALAARALCS